MHFPTVASVLVLASFLATPVLAQDNRSLARANFDQADRNDDGKLSKSEFRIFIDENAKDNIGRAAMVKRYGAYDTAFEQLDANKDGFIVRSEITRAKKK
jgi:hypothetical protein